jgi:hypothetical protein
MTNGHQPSEAIALAQELRTLKRGRGVGADQIATMTGPRLRELCDYRPTDDSDALRIKLKGLIIRASANLPEDERRLAWVALAIAPDARHRFLKQRLESTLRQLDRDAIRTADRLANVGLQRIAENLVGLREDTNPYVADGWYTESLHSTVRLDLDRPELREHRRIVSTRDDLDRLTVSLTVPVRADGTTAAEPGIVVRGGERALPSDQVSPGIYQTVVPLPRALTEGEPYEYDLTFVLAHHSLMRPYYLLTPLQQCQDFRLRVRFDRDQRPAGVWRVDGIPRAVVETTATTPLAPRDGEVTTSFHRLRSGLSYGVHWSMAS